MVLFDIVNLEYQLEDNWNIRFQSKITSVSNEVQLLRLKRMERSENAQSLKGGWCNEDSMDHFIN